MSDSITSSSEIELAQRKIQDFCAAREWDVFHTPKDLAIGVATEAGELLDLFRFKSDEQVREMMKDAVARERVSDELADVFFFVLRFAQMNHIDLISALDQKMAKNARKYPVETAKGSNKKYNE